MSKIPNFSRFHAKYRIDNRISDTLPEKDDHSDVSVRLRKFVSLTMDEASVERKEKFMENMGGLLERLGIIPVASKTEPTASESWFGVNDLNKLAELVGIPKLPNFDESNPDKFYEVVSPFAERLLRSEKFWSIVDENKIDKDNIIPDISDYGYYGEVRTQLCYVKRLREELEKVIEAAKDSEVALQGKLDAFVESEEE